MLGDVLRTVTKHKQECWDLLLNFCEFSVNNPQQTSTCNIPFVPNYGVHPGAPADFSSQVPINHVATGYKQVQMP